MRARATLVAGLFVFLVACSAPYRTPVITGSSGNASFRGVAELLSKERPLDVLLVHGMCTHDASWAKAAVENLYSALGGDPRAISLVASQVQGTGVWLYQQTLSLANGSLRANALLWSGLTTPLKAQLCYDQTEKSAACPSVEAAKKYPYDRAALNRTLKDTILNDCLADAVIYQGRSRDDINAQMQKAILQAVASSGGDRRPSNIAREAAEVPSSLPLVVITESLGSKVAFDAIERLGRDPDPTTKLAAERTFDRTAQIFMEANQLPILALADRKLDGTRDAMLESTRGGYAEDPIAALLSMRALRRFEATTTAPPQVVAFTDPNDLLSYILVPSPLMNQYPVVDVAVSNDTTFVGLVELPTTAHRGYRSNQAVRNLIACGNPAPKKCGMNQ